MPRLRRNSTGPLERGGNSGSRLQCRARTCCQKDSPHCDHPRVRSATAVRVRVSDTPVRNLPRLSAGEGVWMTEDARYLQAMAEFGPALGRLARAYEPDDPRRNLLVDGGAARLLAGGAQGAAADRRPRRAEGGVGGTGKGGAGPRAIARATAVPHPHLPAAPLFLRRNCAGLRSGGRDPLPSAVGARVDGRIVRRRYDHADRSIGPATAKTALQVTPCPAVIIAGLGRSRLRNGQQAGSGSNRRHNPRSDHLLVPLHCVRIEGTRTC